jgi:purine-binding chemotaxis protein CheW
MTEIQDLEPQVLSDQESDSLTTVDETATIEQILARRAARLAEVPTEEEAGEQIMLVLVRLGREVYGLDAQYVGRIRPVEQITRVPRVPNWVAGVTNLRGHVLSVVDLRTLFGLPSAPTNGHRGNGHGDDGATEAPAQDSAYLVAIETPEIELALLVDAVLSVVAMPVSQIQETTSTIRGLRAEHVMGIGKWRATPDDKEELLAVLDMAALVSDERLIIHEEVV